MKSLTKGLLGLGLASALAFTGCSAENDNSGIILPNGPQGGDVNGPGNGQSNSEVPEELQYNYLLLDVLYFYAHLNHELSDDIMDYYEAPLLEDYGYSACTSKYTDVCYMYSKMSDPFTRYYDPNYAAYVMNMLNQSESGVGLGAETDTVTVEDHTAFIFSQVYPQSPAEKAGAKTNDTILSVENTVPGSIKALDNLLTGEDGDSIAIEVKRGEDTLALKIEIGEYSTPTVFVSYKDSIPVIKISEFTNETVSDSGTYGEFVNALRKTDGAKSTIIDLRGNPGGDVDQCNSMSAELLKIGDTIIVDIETNIDSTIQNKQMVYTQVFDTVSYTVTKDGIGKDRYYVFLADSGSASCAEVMLSAVTVNKNSPVVGLTTYGKGIGQFLMPTIKDGLALITGLRSMDKNGNVYHRVGIVPDFESGDSEEQMAKAIEWAKEGTKTRRTEGFYGTESTGHFAMKVRAKKTESVFPKNRKEFLRSLGGKLYTKK